MKLHELTILVRGGSRGLGFAVAGFVLGSAGGGALVSEGLAPSWIAASGIPLAILFGAIGLGYEFLWHQRFVYELTEDTLNIDKGVLFRTEREIPYHRVQNVDIRRSLFQRLLKIASVSIETAGGGTTEAKLQFVGDAEASRLQEEIQTRKRREAGAGREQRAEAGQPIDEAIGGETLAETSREPAAREEELLFELDDRDLILYSVLSFDPRVLSILFVIVPSAAPMVAPQIDQFAASVFLALGVLGALVLAFGIWVTSAFARFVQFYGFRLRQVGDELRYERGLLQRYDGSIPLEKVQTVVVEENLLMRRFDYASLSIQTAGYAPGTSPSGGSEAAVPLAKRDQLFELATSIEPFEIPSFERPPAAARRRYLIRYSLVVSAVMGIAYGVNVFLRPIPWFVVAALFVPIPYAARKKWAHRGWALLDGYAATRNGFWRRQIHVVPDFRVQTVIDRRTIFQRRWGLGTVVVDTASSRSLVSKDAAAVDIAAETADQLRETIAERLQAALGSSGAAGD